MPQVWQDRLVHAALQLISTDASGKGNGFNLHTVSPPEESGNDLQHLEFLGIRSLESEKMNKMISDELSSESQHALGCAYTGTEHVSVFTYLSIFSSGLPFFKYRRAFVR